MFVLKMTNLKKKFMFVLKMTNLNSLWFSFRVFFTLVLFNNRNKTRRALCYKSEGCGFDS